MVVCVHAFNHLGHLSAYSCFDPVLNYNHGYHSNITTITSGEILLSISRALIFTQFDVEIMDAIDR